MKVWFGNNECVRAKASVLVSELRGRNRFGFVFWIKWEGGMR